MLFVERVTQVTLFLVIHLSSLLIWMLTLKNYRKMSEYTLKGLID